MDSDLEEIDLAAMVDGDFSGVVSYHDPERHLDIAQGPADRSTGAPITRATRFAAASATKTISALVALRLVEAGVLGLDAPVAPLVPELARLHQRVTVRHLLEHTSGIGDYLPEDDIADIESFFLPIPADRLACPADLLPLLDLSPATEPGEPFRYNNAGYVVLAVACERAASRDWFALAQDVLDLAGMAASGFFRSDALPPDTALGYLANGDTNERNLPVRGSGDGGVYLTVDDVDAFWVALRAGTLVGSDLVDQMTSVRHPFGDRHYGWGLWLNADATAWWMEGMDAGVSFRSVHVPARNRTCTVVSNTTHGAWPVLRRLDDAGLGRPLA